MHEINVLSKEEVAFSQALEDTREMVGDTLLFVVRSIRRQRKAGRSLGQILRSLEESGLELAADQSGRRR